jgi:hypothetical protein
MFNRMQSFLIYLFIINNICIYVCIFFIECQEKIEKKEKCHLHKMLPLNSRGSPPCLAITRLLPGTGSFGKLLFFFLEFVKSLNILLILW